MKIRPFLILIEFVAITVPLVWWWTHGGLDAYHDIFKRLAFPLLQEMGVTHVSQSLVRDRLIGFIPYTALMLVTPRMALKRRLVGLAVGYAVIFFSHLLLSYWSWVAFGRDGRSTGSMATYFPALVITDAVPFILWALFANSFLLEQLSRVRSTTEPGSRAKPAGQDSGARGSAGLPDLKDG